MITPVSELGLKSRFPPHKKRNTMPLSQLDPLSLVRKSLLCRSSDRPFGKSRSVGRWKPGFKSTQLLSEPGPQPFPTPGLSVLRLGGVG